DAQAAGVCTDRAPITTVDNQPTGQEFPFTFNPALNDLDPDDASGGHSAVLAYVPWNAPGTPNLAATGELAVIQSTGLGYFPALGDPRTNATRFGILDTATNQITGVVTGPPPPTGFTTSRVNQTTGIAYFRGTNLVAIDGRPASPTFNQVILSLSLGTIQSMAIDEVHARLYVTAFTSQGTTFFQGRVFAIDINPVSPTFPQIVGQVLAPNNGQVQGIGVNSVTNRVYFGVVSGVAGLYWMDGNTLSPTLVSGTGAPSSVAVNEQANLVYTVDRTNLHVIDGAT